MPPKIYTARLAEKLVHNDKFTQFQFELMEPDTHMEFTAGQYVSMAVSLQGHRRSYSIMSTPDDNHGFELLVDMGFQKFQGMGTQFLASLKFGDEVKVLGPMGTFVVRSQDPTTPLTFIATGSGVAPFRSMLFDQLQKFGSSRKMTLYWGLRHESELCWVEDLKDLVTQYPNVTFHPVISQALDGWPLCRGRVTDCLSVHNLDAASDSEFYICGSAPMIKDTISVLLDRGVDQDQILLEKFY